MLESSIESTKQELAQSLADEIAKVDKCTSDLAKDLENRVSAISDQLNEAKESLTKAIEEASTA